MRKLVRWKGAQFWKKLNIFVVYVGDYCITKLQFDVIKVFDVYTTFFSESAPFHLTIFFSTKVGKKRFLLIRLLKMHKINVFGTKKEFSISIRSIFYTKFTATYIVIPPAPFRSKLIIFISRNYVLWYHGFKRFE